MWTVDALFVWVEVVVVVVEEVAVAMVVWMRRTASCGG